MSNTQILQHSPSSFASPWLSHSDHMSDEWVCNVLCHMLNIYLISPWSPNISAKWRNFTLASGLVNMSAGFSSVGMYLTDILPLPTASRMKWYQILICFVLTWNLLSFDNVIVPWLLQLMVIGLLIFMQISVDIQSHPVPNWVVSVTMLQSPTRVISRRNAVARWLSG